MEVFRDQCITCFWIIQVFDGIVPSVCPSFRVILSLFFLYPNLFFHVIYNREQLFSMMRLTMTMILELLK